MQTYRLLTTRRHPDGSIETPTMDVVLMAEDDRDAAKQAGRFPLHGYVEHMDYACLVAEDGSVVWTTGLMAREAA